MLPQAGLWVPAVGRLVTRLLYLGLKGVAPMMLRPQSAGWAGPPGFLRLWVPCMGCLFVTGRVARGGGTSVKGVEEGKKEKKKKE